ncbi:cell division protein FtsQ [Paludibacter sp. 221]|uniref:cell division protein FtsQ/DivIB n=1 Tax=Paludibacter sp. 221 TaxID=2302939 RepID=UPI0013CFE05D|nr:cell division protein FtsQ/DivIB [Paludibacter sp. 221]NDV47566.1 cell division protein FtsQ [Paludibacter sp. 221]
MKKKLSHKILITCGLSLAGAYLVFSLSAFTSKNKAIECTHMETVFVNQNEISLINHTEIENFLKSKNLYPVGKMLNDIETEKIENELSKSEMIKAAECYMTPAGIVHLRVKQRTPKFRVISNESYYVDTEGKKIKTSPNYTAYVPVVSGNVSFETATGELFNFISYLEKNSFWNAQIEQIYIRPDHKIELVPRVGDSIIMLGTLDDYESKLDKLKKLYVKAFNEIGWNRYKTIDLQYKGQIVCTK